MPSSTMRTVCVEDHVCTILAVDDDEVIIETLQMFFAQQRGIRLLTATTREGAKEIICNTPNLELVLLDLRLNGYDPIESLKEVVAVSDARVAVIAISGDHLLEDAASKNGAVDFWGKPLLELDIIGRSKFAILNQRKINYHRDMCLKYEQELAEIQARLKTDNPAIEGLSRVRREIKRDANALIQRAN